MFNTKYLFLKVLSASVLVLTACQSEQTHSVEHYKSLGLEEVSKLVESEKCSVDSYKDVEKLSQNCKNIFKAYRELAEATIDFPVVPKRKK